MKTASVVAALSLAIVAASCGGSRVALRPCRLHLGGLEALQYAGGLVAAMPDGSVVAGAAREDRKAKTLVVALHRVDSSCHEVRSFGTNGLAKLSVAAKTGPFGYFNAGVDVIASDAAGGLLIGGNVGRYELIGRLLGDGRLDHSFGHGGWSRIDSHLSSSRYFTIAPLVTSFAFGSSGSIWLGGNDGGAHCCARSFVTQITATGAPLASFGSGGTAVVPNMAGSYITELSPNSDGSICAYVEYEQGGGSAPEVVLFRASGSPDRRFDAALTRWLRSFWPSGRRFTPTLVPGSGGRFALVGGLDRGFPPFGTHERSLGILVSVGPSARIDRQTRFSSGGDEFDNPAAIRLPSGEIVAAAQTYGSGYFVDSVLVRWFSSDGSTRGKQRISGSEIPRHGHIVGLVPGPQGAWLALANTKEFELVPIAAR